MRGETHPIPKGNIASCAFAIPSIRPLSGFLWVSESIRDMNDGLANIKE
jgi:hypothetical protein